MTDAVTSDLAVEVVSHTSNPNTRVAHVYAEVLRSTAEVALNGAIIGNLAVEVIYKNPFGNRPGGAILLVGI